MPEALPEPGENMVPSVAGSKYMRRGNRIEIAERDLAVWDDYLAGKTLTELGCKYGTTVGNISRVVKQLIRRCAEEYPEKAILAREKALYNLTKVQSRAWEIVDYGRDTLPLGGVLKGLPVVPAMNVIRECEVDKARISGILHAEKDTSQVAQAVQVNIRVLNGSETDKHRDVAEAAILHPGHE